MGRFQVRLQVLVSWSHCSFNQSSILFFNVSNNSLTGSIPKTQTLQSFGSDSYSGNPGLYGPPLTATSRSINGTGEPTSGNSPPNSNGDIFKNIFLCFRCSPYSSCDFTTNSVLPKSSDGKKDIERSKQIKKKPGKLKRL